MSFLGYLNQSRVQITDVLIFRDWWKAKGGRGQGGGGIRNTECAPHLRDPACAGDFGIRQEELVGILGFLNGYSKLIINDLSFIMVYSGKLLQTFRYKQVYILV